MNRILKILGVLFILSNPGGVQAESFLVAKTPQDILNHLVGIKDSSIVFIDIDDTIITPASKTFRIAPYNKLLDDIKAHKEQYENYEAIVSNWRLQRKAMLIDQNWPNALVELKRNHKVYGLTKMDSGKFGNINSMEEWRYNELKSLGIEFSNNQPATSINGASFANGILMTGPNSKSATVLQYLEYFNSDLFVLIDDREDHLRDMQEFCAKHSIKFVGILFEGLAKFKDRPDPEVAALQKKYLIEYAKWLEDAQAEAMIKGRK